MKGEIGYVVLFFEWFVEEGKCVYGDMILMLVSDKCIVVMKEVIGVCVVIMLWNFLVVMIMCKVGLVFVVGCLIVVKLVEVMLFFVFVMVVFVECVGVLVGVFSVVMGDLKVIGGELMLNLIVCKLLFMGLMLVGCLLMV